MPDRSRCLLARRHSPSARALAGKPASVTARAILDVSVRLVSNVTVTVSARVSTFVSVTPGTFSSAFLMVMPQAGQVMFSASNTTVAGVAARAAPTERRSEEHTSELQSLMRISSAVFCLKQQTQQHQDRKQT